MTLFQKLAAKMKAEPNPPRAITQGGFHSIQARRNRVRIGMPEWPTKRELAIWAQVESERRGQ